MMGLMCLKIWCLVLFLYGGYHEASAYSTIVCQGQADIVFLLDASTSVGSSDFQKMLKLVKDISGKFRLGSTGVRIGVDTFSSSLRRQIALKSCTSHYSFNKAVDRIRYTKGSTKTGAALTAMRQQSFSTSAGHRIGVPKVAVVITDGQSVNKAATATAARLAKRAGIHILAVGVGKNVNVKELQAIASRSKNVFTTPSFTSLSTLKTLLSKAACEQARTTTTTPRPPGEGRCLPKTAQCSQADVVFLLDSSSSVSKTNFIKMLRFVQSMVRSWTIGLHSVRIGLATFSSDINFFLPLKDSVLGKNALLSIIGGIPRSSGTTNTGAGLRFLRTNMFQSSYGDRYGIPNIAVVITDGKSSRPDLTRKEAQYVRRYGTTVFSVGVGSAASTKELQDIATNPDASHVFSLGSYSSFYTITRLLQRRICSV